MVDFLKANPFVSKEEYMWQWTVGQVKLASYDFTHIEYLKDRTNEPESCIHIDSGNDAIMNDLGIPIMGKKK